MMVDHVVFLFQIPSVSHDEEYCLYSCFHSILKFNKFPKIRYNKTSSFNIVYSSAIARLKEKLT